MNISESQSVIADMLAGAGKKTSAHRQDLYSAKNDDAPKLLERSAAGPSMLARGMFSSSLHHSVRINGETAQPPKASDTGFDFEQVAENVMHFISSTILDAKRNGASEEELHSMFSQAKEGIEQGFSEAIDELSRGGLLTEDIEQGIQKSYDMLQNGVDQLHRHVFGKEDERTATINAVSSSMEYGKMNTGDLVIMTNDGDEVTLSFESIQAFQQQLEVASANRPAAGGFPEINALQYYESIDAMSHGASEVYGSNDSGDYYTFSEYHEKYSAGSEVIALDNGNQGAMIGSMSYQHYESSALSFSVKGELDQDELSAISDLVAQLSGVAEEFYSGDVYKAFEMGLAVGYDESELSGFALQLTQVETQVTSVSALSHQPMEIPAEVQAEVPAIAKAVTGVGDMLQTGAANLSDPKSAIKEIFNAVVEQSLSLQMELLESTKQRFAVVVDAA